MSQDGRHSPGLVRSLINSSAAAAIAETATLPFDTAKVRLQLQNVSRGGERRYKGPVQTIGRIASEEGIMAPFKGWVPGLQRQVLFTGIRLGLYERVKDVMGGGASETPLYAKVAAALCTSAVGITVANPADLVKVRLQACEHPTSLIFTRRQGSALAVDVGSPTYKNAREAYSRIVKEEGLGGLYKGYLANLVRNSIISATELVSYDQAKQTLLEHGFQDGIGVHLLCGLTAGLAATTLGSPWDVIGTRLMAVANSKAPASGKPAPPKQLLPFIAHMAKTEGLGAFYQGFIPNFARIGSFNIVLWLSYEQIKKL